MFRYKILNFPDFNLNIKIINNIFKIINSLIQKEQKWILNIIFITTEEIKKLNKNYRNINKVTDVLSFHYFEDFSNLKNNEIAWELVFCEEKIIVQATKYWLWEEKEFYKLLIHSILHILWYDHKKKEDYIIMQNIEDKIWYILKWLLK